MTQPQPKPTPNGNPENLEKRVQWFLAENNIGNIIIAGEDTYVSDIIIEFLKVYLQKEKEIKP